MKEEKKKEIIYYRESAIQSVIADAMSFVFLGLLFVFNHFVLDDSKVSAVVFFIVFILFTLGKANIRKHIYTDKEKLIEHLKGV